jgi:hypothetical protein
VSLRTIRNLFYLSVIAVAVILDCTGGVIGWAAAVIVLAGAKPIFSLGCQAAEQKGAKDALTRVRQRALADLATDDPVLQEEHQQLQQAGAATHPD